MIFFIQVTYINIEDQGQQPTGDIELHPIGATAADHDDTLV
jgi:hypothetical protein